MIRFDRVTKLYPGNSKPALNAVDVEISAGEFVFLVGASGSGKSSFLRLVLKEERPSSGEIHVLGQRLSAISNRKIPYFRRSLGVVFQDFRLLPGRTVYQNVAFTLQVIGKSRGFIQEAVPDVLEMVGLDGKAQRLPHELSGGEQQRVAIARAVVNKPSILLADEPTGNLDPTTSQGIMQVLARINAGGTTVVMATHDVGIVDQMKRRVIELIHGDIIRDEVEGGYTTSLDLPTVISVGAPAGSDLLGQHFTGPVPTLRAESYPGTQPVFVRTETPVAAKPPFAEALPEPAAQSWSLADESADVEGEDAPDYFAELTDHRLQTGHVEIVQSMFADEPVPAPRPSSSLPTAPAPTVAPRRHEVPAYEAPSYETPSYETPAPAAPRYDAPTPAEQEAPVPATASASALFESTLASTPLFASTTAEHPSYFAATGPQPTIPRLDNSGTHPDVDRAPVHSGSGPERTAPIETRAPAGPASHSTNGPVLPAPTGPVSPPPAAPLFIAPVAPNAAAAQSLKVQSSKVQSSKVQSPNVQSPNPRSSNQHTSHEAAPSTGPVPMTFGVAPAWPAANPSVAPTPPRFPAVAPLSSLSNAAGSASVSTEPVPVITRAPVAPGSAATMTGAFPRLPAERRSEATLRTSPVPTDAPPARAAAPGPVATPAPPAPAATTAPVPTADPSQTGSSSPGRHPLSAALAAQRNLPLPPLPVPSNRPASPSSDAPDERLRRLVNDDGYGDDDALALAVRLGLRRSDAHPEQTSAEEVGPTV